MIHNQIAKYNITRQKVLTRGMQTSTCAVALALFNILVRVNVDMIILRKWRAGQIRCIVMLDNQVSRDACTVIPPPSVITCRSNECI